MSTKITIIVPVYNAESLIGRCLDSILAQTSSNYELLVVDDGSTDATYDIIKEYEEKYSQITVLHYATNEGLAINRRRGISAAKYDYIIFVDSDDTLNPHLIEYLTDMLDKRHFDLIRYKVRLVDDKPGKNHERFNSPPLLKSITGVEALKAWSIPGNKYALFWLYCFHKSLFSKFEIPNFRYNEDMCSIPFLILNSDSVINLDYVGYNYTHSNPLSMTNDRSEKAMNFKAKIFFEAYDFIIQHFLDFNNLDYESKIFFIDDFKKSLTKKYNSFSDELKNTFKEEFESRINKIY